MDSLLQTAIQRGIFADGEGDYTGFLSKSSEKCKRRQASSTRVRKIKSVGLECPTHTRMSDPHELRLFLTIDPAYFTGPRGAC
jgi:hypothetical protein